MIEGNVAGAQNVDVDVIPRGNDGFSPLVKIIEVEGGHKVSITDIDGAKEAVILDGADGRGIMMFYQSKITTLPGDTNEWTILYTDGTQSVISVKNGEDGEDGRSVNIESITESDEDGGENVVQFSSFRPNDPNTRLIVKNGSKGSPGYTPQKGIDYFDGYTPQKNIDYFDGKDGESVSVSSVSESSVDGGENVVTFSNGTKLSVRNGKTGTPGYTPQKGVDYFDGSDGYTPKKGVDYTDGYTPIKGRDYFDGEDGKDGKSITVVSVTESPDDNGENVVTFSDGKKLVVRNGGQGGRGERGDSGVTAPLSGFFTLTVDEDGNLYALTADGDNAPVFEYDEETGDLYFVTESE